MFVDGIDFSNFLTYKKCSLKFSSKINIIVGLNGSGKSNLLSFFYNIFSVNKNSNILLNELDCFLRVFVNDFNFPFVVERLFTLKKDDIYMYSLKNSNNFHSLNNNERTSDLDNTVFSNPNPNPNPNPSFDKNKLCNFTEFPKSYKRSHLLKEEYKAFLQTSDIFDLDIFFIKQNRITALSNYSPSQLYNLLLTFSGISLFDNNKKQSIVLLNECKKMQSNILQQMNNLNKCFSNLRKNEHKLNEKGVLENQKHELEIALLFKERKELTNRLDLLMCPVVYDLSRLRLLCESGGVVLKDRANFMELDEKLIDKMGIKKKFIDENDKINIGVQDSNTPGINVPGSAIKDINVNEGGINVNEGGINVNEGGINVNEGGINVNEGGINVNGSDIHVNGVNSCVFNTDLSVNDFALLNLHVPFPFRFFKYCIKELIKYKKYKNDTSLKENEQNLINLKKLEEKESNLGFDKINTESKVLNKTQVLNLLKMLINKKTVKIDTNLPKKESFQNDSVFIKEWIDKFNDLRVYDDEEIQKMINETFLNKNKSDHSSISDKNIQLIKNNNTAISNNSVLFINSADISSKNIKKLLPILHKIKQSFILQKNKKTRALNSIKEIHKNLSIDYKKKSHHIDRSILNIKGVVGYVFEIFTPVDEFKKCFYEVVNCLDLVVESFDVIKHVLKVCNRRVTFIVLNDVDKIVLREENEIVKDRAIFLQENNNNQNDKTSRNKVIDGFQEKSNNKTAKTSINKSLSSNNQVLETSLKSRNHLKNLSFNSDNKPNHYSNILFMHQNPRLGLDLHEQIICDPKYKPFTHLIAKKAIITKTLKKGLEIKNRNVITMEGEFISKKGNITGGYENKENRFVAINEIKNKLNNSENEMNVLMAEISRLESNLNLVNDLEHFIENFNEKCDQNEVNEEYKSILQKIASLNSEPTNSTFEINKIMLSRFINDCSQNINLLRMRIMNISTELNYCKNSSNLLRNKIENFDNEKYKKQIENLEIKYEIIDELEKYNNSNGNAVNLDELAHKLYSNSENNKPFMENNNPFHETDNTFINNTDSSLLNNIPFMETNIPFMETNIPFMETNISSISSCEIEFIKQKLDNLNKTLANTKENLQLSTLSKQNIIEELKKANKNLKKYIGINKNTSLQEKIDSLKIYENKFTHLKECENKMTEFIEKMENKKKILIEETFEKFNTEFSQIYKKLSGNECFLKKENEGIFFYIENKNDVNNNGNINNNPNINNNNNTNNNNNVNNNSNINSNINNNKNDVNNNSNLENQSNCKKIDTTALSTGQKTIIALSIIFSIQIVEKLPFYFLDEIDCNLDKNNREKVASLINDLSKNTQYFIITHKNEILEYGHRFYKIEYENKISTVEEISKTEAKKYIIQD